MTHVSSLLPRKRNELRELISEYHRHGFVHGDIRKPNILVSNSDNTDFRLIDFDWAGRHETARYPSMMNSEIPWPGGVDLHALIESRRSNADR
ncbi:hypothetical protein F5887DRAFT_946481 [Amanita rubescens]|nr:hypothetical protein F5887DRAFT_946481 [Amanita rubescens]